MIVWHTALSLGLALASGTAADAVTLDYRGSVDIPEELTVEGYAFGGISGLVYDPQAGLYHAVADDPDAPRLHTLTLDIADGTLGPGDVTVLSSTLLRDTDQAPFAADRADPEGIVLMEDDLIVASEALGRAAPAFIRRYDRGGRHLESLPLEADRYAPRADTGTGARWSGGFESLSLSTDGRTLYAGFEVPLRQDAPDYDPRSESRVRILALDPTTGERRAEYVYTVGPATLQPFPADGYYGRGLNEILAIGPGEFLSVERQYAQGVTVGLASHPVEVFHVTLDGAADVSTTPALGGAETPVTKTRLLEMADLLAGTELTRIGSFEAMALGPPLPDGSQSLLMIEDNDFMSPTQVILFAFRP